MYLTGWQVAKHEKRARMDKTHSNFKPYLLMISFLGILHLWSAAVQSGSRAISIMSVSVIPSQHKSILLYYTVRKKQYGIIRRVSEYPAGI